MSETSIGHMPQREKWEFDESVTGCFDHMLRRSIPQYDVMRKAVVDVAAHAVWEGGTIVDLGCSRGDALWSFFEIYRERCRYVGVEISEPMLAAAREKFGPVVQQRGIVDIRQMDLRSEFPEDRACVILAVLTIQFTPIEYRLQILRRAYEQLRDGGAFVFVEKVIGSSAGIDDVLKSVDHGMKLRNGYTQEQVDRKKHSLEGVLVPVTAAWNEDMLRSAGFDQVDCFWRWMNFAGWVARKGK